MLPCIARCEVVKGQACQEGRVVDDRSYGPFLLQIDVILVDIGLFGAIQNGEHMWARCLL